MFRVLLNGWETNIIQYGNVRYFEICSVAQDTERHIPNRKQMFYLRTHSTHFIYGYMTSNSNDDDNDNGDKESRSVLRFFMNVTVSFSTSNKK